MFLHEILQTMLKPLPTTLATSNLINYNKGITSQTTYFLKFAMLRMVSGLSFHYIMAHFVWYFFRVTNFLTLCT